MQFDQLKRREFITLLGGAAIGWPLAARAQQPSDARRVVVLASLAEDHPEMKLRVAAFREGLERLGWSEGRNVRIDYRFASAPNQSGRKELLALRIAGFFKGAETSRRKRAIATLSGLVGALTLARAVDDPALRRKSWSRRVVRLGRDYSVSPNCVRAHAASAMASPRVRDDQGRS